MRAKTEIEQTDNGRERIIVSEIPYMVNKAEMIRKTAELINEKKIEGISDLRDESDRDGMRIVYELKRDSITSVVLNNLFKYTQLQSSFSVNNIALVNGRPELLNLKKLISCFVDHRHDVVVRRTKFDLEQAEKRAHILEGFLIALDNLDAIITLIRASRTPDDARDGLMESFGLTEIQARAILNLTLQRLTGLERDKIRDEYAELMKTIDYLKSILADESLRMKIIKDELAEIKEKYGDERRTHIIYDADDQRIEDLIADEPCVITVSHMGYIKRTNLNEYRTQKRGGKGSIGSNTRDEDFLEHLFVATTHNYLLFFTKNGRCFWMRAFEVPEGAKTAKGRAIQNLINIPPDDKVVAYVNVKNLADEEYINNNFIIMCTNKGTIKKTSLEAYSRPRTNGINAITVREGEMLLEARLTNGTSEIMMALKSGRAIRFPEIKVRPMGRNAAGVRGVTLKDEQDEVVGMVCAENTSMQVMVVSERGYGKRSEIEEYRITNRGGKGVKTINITEKTGNLIAILGVKDEEDLMIITRSGITIRTPIEDLRVQGRATQGVRLINLKGNQEIAAVCTVEKEEESDEELIDGVAPEAGLNPDAEGESASETSETE
jgi:DNA gyrase subunit A